MYAVKGKSLFTIPQLTYLLRTSSLMRTSNPQLHYAMRITIIVVLHSPATNLAILALPYLPITLSQSLKSSSGSFYSTSTGLIFLR